VLRIRDDEEGDGVEGAATWRDSFATVLALLIAMMLIVAILGEDYYASQLAVVVMAVAVLEIYRASGVKGKGRVVALSIAGVAVATSFVGIATDTRTALVISGAAMLVLLAMSPAVIARRLKDFTRIGLETVFAALCIYLIIGMFFSVLYQLIGNLHPDDFFVQAGVPTTMDSMYFSFTTLTTLGYGDLTPAGDIGRMLAITEALFGQIYLVTVVALIVSNLGRRRSRQAKSADEDDE
jgi:hypothetical protein